jgi:exosortase/archaeosortase family protein
VRGARLGIVDAGSPVVRLIAAYLLACLAFLPSLLSLLAQFRFSTPTGELILVPVITFVLLLDAVRRRPDAWRGRLGWGDVLTAAVLLAVCVTVFAALPDPDVNDTWMSRVDLLAFPLAVCAGCVALLGMRVLVLAGPALGYGFLVWPMPWNLLYLHTVSHLTDATYWCSVRLIEAFGVGTAVAGDANTVFVPRGDDGFEISVASSCSGVSGLLAFSVVAAAFMTQCRGSLRARSLWAGIGLVAVWSAGIGRIVAIAWVGSVWGSGFALQVLHPVAGLVLDCAVLGTLVVLAPRFGLHRRTSTPSGAGNPNLPPPPGRSVLLRATGCALVAVALLVTGVRGSSPSLASGRVQPAATTLDSVKGVSLSAVSLGEVTWARAFFGDKSRWVRYQLDTPVDAGTMRIWVDSVVTDDAAAFRAHDVIGCYSFHGYDIRFSDDLLVAPGLSARRLVVRQQDGSVWNSLYWQWPVLKDGQVRYERVVLFGGASPADPTVAGLSDVGSPSAPLTSDPAPDVTAHFLTVARSLLASGST